jgi:chemotaxis protein MotA
MPPTKTSSFAFKPAQPQYDLATILGLGAALLVIGLTLILGGHYKVFFDLPSFIIVFGGTFAITMTATSWNDFVNTLGVVKTTFFSSHIEQRQYVKQLLDLSMMARQRGLIAMQQYEAALRSDPYLMRAIRMVADGIKPTDMEQLLKQEIDTSVHRQEQAVSILRRAAEISPAMGLIGTLVGLVQMLSRLEDPSTIGPAMALALLTTFYGALLGTVFLTPLATKLEKRTDDEVTQKVLVLSATLSMARQENPRHLEAQLNTLLAPKNRIIYFEE